MPLPPPQPRRLLHTRQVTFHGYEREDGLWDIEGTLLDSKTQPLVIPTERTWQAGEPIHGMSIRITTDRTFVVRDIAVSMDDAPHGDCPSTQAPMQKMIGATMGPGWRQAIDKHLGGIKGCAHLRELLFNMATAAYQTLAPAMPKMHTDKPPPHLGKCHTWDFDGPLVQKLYPMFFQRGPKPRAAESEEKA